MFGIVRVCKRCCFNRGAVCVISSHKKHNAAKKTLTSSINLEDFPPERIKNFGIIAHVDHGKSTIADRLLEITGAISKSSQNKQVLDRLQVERERGITVKAQTASIVYKVNNEEYLLNLIDTPGHVDFTYEVSRSLSACQGVLLVVDAAQGIQAQTLANFYLALEQDLEVIPIINKIDLKNADVPRVKQELNKLLDLHPDNVICVSAKLGTNINAILKSIVEKIPSPAQANPSSYDNKGLLKALLFDSTFEKYRGVIANVLVVNGKLRKGDHITTQWLQERTDKGKKSYEVKEIGILRPENHPTDVLYSGQVGYIVCGMKNTREAQIGDTLFQPNFPVTPLPGFSKAKPVVFGCMYPIDQSEFKALEAALNRLLLNDRSVSMEPSSSAVLGAGFRLGFLGLLHLDVFQQRLEQEYDAKVVMTSPNVVYKALLKPTKKKGIKEPSEVTIRMPCDFPDKQDVLHFYQPFINATIITPSQFENDILNLCLERYGVHTNTTEINETRQMLQFHLPMNEVIVDFYDKLKSITSGYASFDYEETGYEETDLVKLDFLLNGDIVEELSTICPSYKSREQGAKICLKLRSLMPRQQFALAIQAAIGNTIVARETLPAKKKDVLVKCSGGDYTRKLKLLRRHATHQKKLRENSAIYVPKSLFIDILK